MVKIFPFHSDYNSFNRSRRINFTLLLRIIYLLVLICCKHRLLTSSLVFQVFDRCERITKLVDRLCFSSQHLSCVPLCVSHIGTVLSVKSRGFLAAILGITVLPQRVTQVTQQLSVCKHCTCANTCSHDMNHTAYKQHLLLTCDGQSVPDLEKSKYSTQDNVWILEYRTPHHSTRLLE